MKTTKLLIGMLCLVFFQPSVHSSAVIGLHCPDDVWLNCGAQIYNLSAYGDAYYTDYYGNHDAGPATVEYFLSGCNTGTIIRTWTYNQFSCSQTIHIYGSDFSEQNIIWPNAIVELEGCNPSTDPLDLDPEDGPPTFDYVHCSSVGTSYKDQTFTFGPDCKKTIRTWTVIDWCKYHPNHSPYTGIWTFHQTIKVSATDVPDFDCLPDITVSSFNCEDAYVLLDDQTVDNSSCGGTYYIEHNSIYADTIGANASGIYPIGTTEVRYKLGYGCGQTRYCYQKITIIDDKDPYVICFGSLAVALMGMDEDNDGIPEDGMVEIWAKDIDYGSTHACNRELHYSFSPDIDSTSRVFTCAEVGVNEVRMYVTDHKGNQSFCVVEIDVQNNAANIPNCEPGSTKPEATQNISGLIETHLGKRLNKSFIHVKSMEEVLELTPNEAESGFEQIEEILDSFYNSRGEIVYDKLIDSVFVVKYDTTSSYRIFDEMSDAGGEYIIGTVGMDYEYKLSPWRVYAKESNMNIYDVQALFNHVVGRQPLSTPYEMLAADVDQNGKLEMEDVNILLSYVEGNRSHINPEERWIFIDANFSFDPEISIFEQDYPDYIMIHANTYSTGDKSFVAVCLGDISAYGNDQQQRESLVEKEIETTIRNKMDAAYMTVDIAPNPFIESTSFKFNPNNGSLKTLEIFNSAGQSVYKTESKESEIRIDNLNLSGVYLYHIVVEDKSFQGRLIKF